MLALWCLVFAQQSSFGISHGVRGSDDGKDLGGAAPRKSIGGAPSRLITASTYPSADPSPRPTLQPTPGPLDFTLDSWQASVDEGNIERRLNHLGVNDIGGGMPDGSLYYPEHPTGAPSPLPSAVPTVQPTPPPTHVPSPAPTATPTIFFLFATPGPLDGRSFFTTVGSLTGAVILWYVAWKRLERLDEERAHAALLEAHSRTAHKTPLAPPVTVTIPAGCGEGDVLFAPGPFEATEVRVNGRVYKGQQETVISLVVPPGAPPGTRQGPVI